MTVSSLDGNGAKACLPIIGEKSANGVSTVSRSSLRSSLSPLLPPSLPMFGRALWSKISFALQAILAASCQI